jgi:hypothetical protein
MPITYEVDHNTQRVQCVATGDIRLEDMAAHVTALADAHCLGYPQLFDARGAALTLTAEETRRIVPLIGRLRDEHGQARTAFIADSDVSFGMARMYATLAADSDTGFMVYRTLDEGTAWLGWQRAASEHISR